jgi:L-histidine Nalpha-methyltransferase
MPRPAAEPTTPTVTEGTARDFARAVMIGLSDRPRWLPCRFLYDTRGTELFEAITTTPEYYLTRTEAGILAASSEAIAAATGPVALVELGAGMSSKTGHLLAAYRTADRPVRYYPIDVSAAALQVGRNAIRQTHPGVDVTPVHSTYDAAFPMLRELSPVMLIFLGSSIGNFNQTEARSFWRTVARHLAPGDFVLLGVDLVKDEATINAAYNDEAGHSAAFTRNLFARMNRELGADLDLHAVTHEAAYNADWQRVEIFARFTTAQTLTLEPLDRRIHIDAGERIMTEISRKYLIENLGAYLECFGFRVERIFTDSRHWFADLLLRRIDNR